MARPPAEGGKDPFRVVLVEPDDEYAALVEELLRRMGGRAERVGPDEALAVAQEEGIRLALVDAAVVAGSGRSVLRELRERTALPAIALSDADGADDVVRRAIEHADYELVRPFSPRRFRAAVRVVARRGRTVPGTGLTADEVALGALRLNSAKLEASAGGRWVALSAREFSLLYVLATRPGVVMTRDELVARAWGWTTAGETRAVDNVVARIRRKLGDDGAEPRVLLTERGSGYRLAVP